LSNSNLHLLEILVLPEQIENELDILNSIKSKTGICIEDIKEWRIIKKSIDARKSPVKFRLEVEINLNDIPFEPIHKPVYSNLQPTLNQHAIVVGFGPAGMFAALELLKCGIKPIVIERGKNVRERRRDLAKINKEGIVNPDSNYCFGEGGAGTYSDGKLYTRSSKRGSVEDVLNTFVEHGATEDILINTRPHIGTNKLPGIVESIRETIQKLGGEIIFDCKLTDIHIHDNKIKGIETSNGFMQTENIILATGHSARDIYELLEKKNILIEAKPFALGVRIEHPQEIIDKAQYHCDTKNPNLPPAYYSLVTQAAGKGVFSFCMCPGGIIAPAATAPGEIVVNGWSPSKRNGKFANSGLVVSVDENDWKDWQHKGNLSALYFQKEVETKAYLAGGGNLVAPAQKIKDFIRNKESSSLPECSYIPGISSANLHQILPAKVRKSLQEGLIYFSKKIKGFDSDDGIMLATESRTSSPIRIPRDKETLEHTEITGLYPCGEGAGYAGGIVSAAIDGIRCAKEIAQKKTNPKV
jgi:uncharacterized FAD-dependent dehydrogenase